MSLNFEKCFKDCKSCRVKYFCLKTVILYKFSGSWSNLSRRSQTTLGNKENTAPVSGAAALLTMPPPALSEETLMAPEHNEILAKLKYISVLVDKIIEVARHKAAPLSAIGETVCATIRSQKSANPGSNSQTARSELGQPENSPHHRRLQQLLLYMRCLHILSQTLDLSRAELKAKKLKPSTSVKNSKQNMFSSLLRKIMQFMMPAWIYLQNWQSEMCSKLKLLHSWCVGGKN